MYLIGAFNNGKLAQKYLYSLSVLGDSVEPIFIQYLRHGKFDEVAVPSNVKLIKYKKPYPGNTGKHKDFREILSPLLERDAWCIFTDMHDVVFQRSLPDFEDRFWSMGIAEKIPEIIIASEAKTFGEINYWKEIFPQDVWDLEVFNVGCFVMKRDILREFWEYLYEEWMNFYSWYKNAKIPRFGSGDAFPFNIPYHDNVRIEMAIMFNNHFDTLCYNKFIRKHKTSEIPGLFACYGFQVEKKIVEAKDGGLYLNGELVSIAHYNGNTKKFMKRKEAK